jgi:hypothetical protein
MLVLNLSAFDFIDIQEVVGLIPPSPLVNPEIGVLFYCFQFNILLPFPGTQAVPDGVIDTWGNYSIVDTPYFHLWSSYPLDITSFQTSRG